MVCLQMRGNRSNNQRPGNSGNSVEHGQKLIRSEEAMSWPMKFEPKPISILSAKARRLLDRSDARKRRDVQQSMIKSKSGWGRAIMYVFTKFQINPLIPVSIVFSEMHRSVTDGQPDGHLNGWTSGRRDEWTSPFPYSPPHPYSIGREQKCGCHLWGCSY